MLIRRIQEKHHYRYGIPRVKEELKHSYGKRVRAKKAARLMRENGLNARRRRKSIETTDSRHGLPVCGNILNRKFHAEQAGAKWVSDITYLRTVEGWVFLTVVLDLYDRKVIGGALSGGLETVYTAIPAVEMALVNRKAQDGLRFHADRGVQYCAKTFRGRLEELCPTVRLSMSRKGNCWDHACAE
ncbi:MAG: IS3 family transposase, partial [Treponema sp.]|nr:IS3 family transposase [Treponema sp.]